MKRSKPVVLIALNFAIACIPVALAASQSNAVPANAPAEARAAADVGLQRWINQFIKEGVRPGKHFVLDVATIEQLKSARLGRAFATTAVDPKRLMAGSSLRQATYADGEWRFVVMVGQRAVGLVEVRQVGGKYQMVGLGSKALAQDIENTLAPYPGRTASLLRIHSTHADYMELAANNPSRSQYAPLRTARSATATTRAEGLIEEAGLTAELRTAIANHADTP